MESRAPLFELSKTSEKDILRYRQIIEECREKNTKYTDPNFYPQIDVKPQDKNLLKDVEWKRAEERWGTELFKNLNEYTLCQGVLSDCFLISSLCHVAKTPRRVKELFVEPVDISTGCVCIKFQIFEKPVYVIVDTFLPFSEDMPRFSHPRDDDGGYWFTLVEKAYTKFLGSCHAIKGGAAITAMYHMFGYIPQSKKVAECDKPSNQLREYLNQTTDVFASIDRSREAVEAGLTDDHTYAVYGIDELGGKTLIHLRNPHGKSDWQGDFSPDSPCWEIGYKKKVGFKEGGHFWLTEYDFLQYFSSISAAIPIPKGWTMQTAELQVEKDSVDGGRTPFGNGPFVGHLHQFLVKFTKPTTVNLLFEEVSPNHHSHVAFLQQNDCMKISQAGKTNFFLKTSDETVNSQWEIKDVSQPYTLVLSREHPTDKSFSHLYLRMYAPEKFEIRDLPEPDFDNMHHEVIKSALRPGNDDDRYPGKGKTVDSVRQWRVNFSRPCKLYLRMTKDKTQTKHIVFLGHAMKSGKMSRKLKDYFALTMKVHQNAKLEEWAWKITDLRRPLVVGVCRDRSSSTDQFELDMYSDAAFDVSPVEEAEDLEEPHTAEIEGTLVRGKNDDRTPYGSVEGLSPLQQYRVKVKQAGRIYLLFSHDGRSKHNIAVLKTHRYIDHFGVGDNDYFETTAPTERFYWDVTPGDWALCVHRDKQKKESNWKLKLVSASEFSIEPIPLPDYENLNCYTVEVTLGPGMAIGNADGISPFRSDMTPLRQWRVCNAVPQFLYFKVSRTGPDMPTYVYMQKNDGLKSKCSYVEVPDRFYKMKCNSQSECFSFDMEKIDGPWTLCITRPHKHKAHTRVTLEIYAKYPLKITEIDDEYTEADQQADNAFLAKVPPDVNVDELQEEFLQRQKKAAKWAEEDEEWEVKHDAEEHAKRKGEDYTVTGEGEITEDGLCLGPQYDFYVFYTGKLDVSVTKQQGTEVTAFIGRTKENHRTDDCLTSYTIPADHTQAQFSYFVRDNTEPFVLGFYKNEGDSANFHYTISPPGKVDLYEAEAFEDIPSKQISGELNDKDDGKSPYGTGPGLSSLQQFFVTVGEECKVFLSLRHEGKVHRIALQQNDEKISKFTSLPDAAFKSTHSRDIFVWNATPGKWALCVYRDNILGSSEWTLDIASHAEIDVEEIPQPDTEKLKEDSLKTELVCDTPIFKADLRTAPQWHIAVPGNQKVFAEIRRKGGVKADVIVFMQDLRGKRIRSSLKNVREEIHMLTKDAKVECFEFEQKEQTVYTCVLTRANAESEEPTEVEVVFFSNTGVLVSEFDGDKYTVKMEERENEFFESVNKNEQD